MEDPGVSNYTKVEYLGPIISNMKILSYLVNDIVFFSQYHSDTISYKETEFSMKDLITEIKVLF